VVYLGNNWRRYDSVFAEAIMQPQMSVKKVAFCEWKFRPEQTFLGAEKKRGIHKPIQKKAGDTH